MKRLWAVCLALTLALGLCGCESWGTAGPSPSPSPTPARDPAPVLAFFGASAEPWQEELRDGVAEWCDREGWELVEYDCLGWESTQTVQVDDLARSGGAEMAVLCAVSQSSLEKNAPTLAGRGVKVLTFCDSPSGPTERPQGSLAHLAPESEEMLRVAAAFFREEMAENTGVVIRHDVETEPLEEPARAILEDAGVSVLEETYTWGSMDFAQTYLADTLSRHSNVGGVLTFSRAGAQGTRSVLDAAGQEDVKILCMDCTEELLTDLAEGGLDGVMALPAQGTAAQLQAALTDVAAGKAPGNVRLNMEAQKK